MTAVVDFDLIFIKDGIWEALVQLLVCTQQINTCVLLEFRREPDLSGKGTTSPEMTLKGVELRQTAVLGDIFITRQHEAGSAAQQDGEQGSNFTPVFTETQSFMLSLISTNGMF